MRSVLFFPAGERAATVAALDRHLPAQRYPWFLEDGLYIDINDEQTGCLFSDWEPEQIALLDVAVGHHPTWAVQIDISGRIDGTAEIRHMAALLLRHGGVAFDDYTEHPWTLQEIESRETVDGMRFFDFRGHYGRSRGR